MMAAAGNHRSIEGYTLGWDSGRRSSNGRLRIGGFIGGCPELTRRAPRGSADPTVAGTSLPFAHHSIAIAGLGTLAKGNPRRCFPERATRSPSRA